MPDEPTAWELQRNYQALRDDVRNGFNQMNARLDKLPTGELVTQIIAALEHRVKEAEADVLRLENDIKEERKARTEATAANRRIVIGAALAGVVSVIVTVVSPLLTGGG